MITFTQTGVPAVTSGFVAGLEVGSVQLWQPATGWVELRGNFFFTYDTQKVFTDVTHLATLGGSIVVLVAGTVVNTFHQHSCSDGFLHLRRYVQEIGVSTR